LHQHCRPQVFRGIPPIGGAGGGAAGAEDAFVKAVELFALGGGLAVLAAIWWGTVALEVGFDGLVLFVELGEVWDEILDDVGVGERVDAGFFCRVGRNAA